MQARPCRLLLVAGLLTVNAGMVAAQGEPGPTVTTHHETIPNPVFGSAFRVASACRGAAAPCAWEDAATWSAGTVPDLDTRVIVDGVVTIRGTGAVARSVGVYPAGRLSFNPSAATRLRTAELVVFAGGTLQIGTRALPIAPAASAEVVIRDLPFAGDPRQHLRGLVVVDGTLEVHGRRVAESFLRTAAPPAAGSATVVLEASALAAGWRTGDPVAIPTSAQCPVHSNGTCPDQTEERSVTAISADGRTLTLSSPLAFDHPGARDSAGALDFLPHVVNKGRNVILRSENPAGVRGHVLLHGRAAVDIRYASIQHFGRTNIGNLGPGNEKGRYPLHAHHLIGRRRPRVRAPRASRWSATWSTSGPRTGPRTASGVPPSTAATTG